MYLLERKYIMKNSKQRLFEMMGNVNPEFKKKEVLNENSLNEATDQDKYESVVFMQGEEAEEPLRILNDEGEEAALTYLQQWHDHGHHMGSDSLNNGSNDNTFEKDGYHMSWNPHLNYIGLDYEFPVDDETTDTPLNENEINPKYSHFAVYKPNGKIVNGWEYAGYDPEDLKVGKKEYFFDDIVDMDFKGKDINILTKKTLEKRAINPFDMKNWYTERFNQIDENLEDRNFDVNKILDGYIETALWSSGDDGEFDEKTIHDVDDASKNVAKNDILQFINQANENAKDELNSYDESQLGHYLWLSRNGHGAGFFDDNNDKLQDIARSMKEKNVYTGDDGIIYID